MWRKTIVTGLAVVALAACGGGAPSRTPAQQHYIEDVITGWQNTYGTSLPITEALVIKGGNADCAGLASGLTIDNVLSAEHSTNVNTAHIESVMLNFAVSDLCPNYQSELNDWLAAHNTGS